MVRIERHRHVSMKRHAAPLVVALAAVPVKPIAASMRSGYQTMPHTDAPSMIASVGSASPKRAFIVRLRCLRR